MNPIISDPDDEFYNPGGRYYKVCSGVECPQPMRIRNVDKPISRRPSDEPQDRSQKHN